VPSAHDLLFPATSVEEEAGIRIDRIELLHDLLNLIISWRAKMTRAEFHSAYLEHLAFQGEKVLIQQGDLVRSGILMGINPNGDLSLLGDDGNLVSVTVGDVHLRPA
jgi:biotin-(acetyl-CoA carboxylase) ligase